jgi:gamma-glutamyl-gamma-aminobutyraldehyde dehydrogenase
VSEAHFDKVAATWGRTVKVLIGGKAEDMFVEPTVAEVSADAKQAREEIFGPVLSRA